MVFFRTAVRSREKIPGKQAVANSFLRTAACGKNSYRSRACPLQAGARCWDFTPFGDRDSKPDSFAAEFWQVPRIYGENLESWAFAKEKVLINGRHRWRKSCPRSSGCLFRCKPRKKYTHPTLHPEVVRPPRSEDLCPVKSQRGFSFPAFSAPENQTGARKAVFPMHFTTGSGLNGEPPRLGRHSSLPSPLCWAISASDEMATPVESQLSLLKNTRYLAVFPSGGNPAECNRRDQAPSGSWHNPRGKENSGMPLL